MDRLLLAQLTQLYMTVKLECPFYDVNDTCIDFYGPHNLPTKKIYLV